MKKYYSVIIVLIIIFLNACHSTKVINLTPYNKIEQVGMYISNDSLHQQLELLNDSTFNLYYSNDSLSNIALSQGEWYHLKDNMICLHSELKPLKFEDVIEVESVHLFNDYRAALHLDIPEELQTDSSSIVVELNYPYIKTTKDTTLFQAIYNVSVRVSYHKFFSKNKNLSKYRRKLAEKYIEFPLQSLDITSFNFFILKVKKLDSYFLNQEFIHEYLYVSSPNKLYWRNREWVKQ